MTIPIPANVDAGPYAMIEPQTRAEMRRRLAASDKVAYRLLATVRRPDLLPFASARIAECIGRIEACRTPWRPLHASHD